MNMIRLEKCQALRFAKKWTLPYVEVFFSLKQEGGRVRIDDRYAQIRQKFGSYVQLYDDERKIGVAIMLALYGEAGFKEFKEEASSWAEADIAEYLSSLASDEHTDELDKALALPTTEDEWKEQEELVADMPEEEKQQAAKQGAFLFSGFFAQFFNTLALMTHGAKLTALVPQAIQGEQDAFLKAVQVDRQLLTHHPYFITRKQEAQDKGETEFLRALAYRESNPNLKGKIKYPGLYMLFGLLESINWLDDLSHDELLDLCDEIGLDRFQNRIEDVTYLTKRLIEYRRFQKTGGVSMH